MKTINRYIIGELLKTFIFSLIIMTTLLVVVGVVREMLTRSVPPEKILLLIPYIVVETSRISLPMTLLLAVTTFFARMAGNSEVIALKSLGIAPWRILWPVIFLSFLVSLLSVWLNDLAVTWGRRGISAVIYRAAEDIILNELKTKHTFTSPGGELTIMVKGVDENKRLISPSISVKKPPTTIEAKYARLNIDFVNSEFGIDFSEMKVDSTGNVKYSTDFRTVTLPLENILSPDTYRGPSETGLQEIPMAVAEIEDQSAGIQRRVAARQAFAFCLGSIDEWATPDEWNRWQTLINNHRKSIDRYEVESPRRWSSGFCCLFFIWLGAPLAIWMKKTDIFASFFACFVPILLFYYPLFMFGLQGAKNGSLPAVAVWIGNVCLAGAGYWFWRQIHRY